MYRRRARRESMMLLLKVLVTSIEGVDDSPSYAVATSKEGVNDAASGDKHGRFQLHARKESTMALSKVPVTCAEGVIDDIKVPATCIEVVNDVTTEGRGGVQETDDGANNDSTSKHGRSWRYKRFQGAIHSFGEFKPLTSLLVQCEPQQPGCGRFDDGEVCEQRQQGRARGCVEGFDDGATEDSDNHVKLLPCSDIPLYDDKEMLKGWRTTSDTWNVRRCITSLCLAFITCLCFTLGMLRDIVFKVFLGHTISSLVLEWRPLAISLLMLAMKFSICGGGILCLQQVDASWNIPSKALLGSSRSIEGSRYDELVTGYFVVRARLSFLTMLSKRVEEMTSWLPATLSFVLTCHFFDE
ncbi:uncharacterized protein G2W53_004802 [Senna tora]|uniref:Uncharacterized protein n=1 Tax=Senna tora TaxID=362788 RepID=A0A835CHJ1_9FABA|nr:uncharacterized protein G2W53_004802 [Senna tora]